VRIAELLLKIRGFGHVKERNLQAVKTEEVALLAQFERPRQFVVEAAE
jgi:indolepyruvate ferredoxin oxidoreductase